MSKNGWGWFCVVCAGLWLVLSAGTASGAWRTWTGGGKNSNWSTADNWSGHRTISNGDIARFSSLSVAYLNNYYDLNLSSLSILMDSFLTAPVTISGNTLNLLDLGIRNQSDYVATINCDTKLLPGTVRFEANPGKLVIGGDVDLNGKSIYLVGKVRGVSHEVRGAIKGGGTVIYQGAYPTSTCEIYADQQYTNRLDVRAGIVKLMGGHLPRDTYVYLNRVNSSVPPSVLDLNGYDQTIRFIYESKDGSSSIRLGGATLTMGVGNKNWLFKGVITGKGSVVKQGTGSFYLYGACTYQGTMQVVGGTLSLQGGDDRLPPGSSLEVWSPATVALNDNNQTIHRIWGDGVVDTGTGLLSITGAVHYRTVGGQGSLTLGNFALAAGATFRYQIDSATPPGVVATGSVDLSRGRLQVEVQGGYTPSLGQQFTLINKTSPGPVNGTFNGKPEGATFKGAGGNTWRITYAGGDGNDVVITRVVDNRGGGGGSRPQPTPEPRPQPKPRPAPPVDPKHNSPKPTATGDGPNLSWPHVEGSNFYRVYRATCPTCPKQEVGRVPGTSFTDSSAPPGRVYYYFVRTENAGGLSDYSEALPAWNYDRNPGRPGDFNHDGVSDLLWWDTDSGQLQVSFIQDGRPQGQISLGPGLDPGQWLLTQSRDLDGDGVTDLLWWNPDQGSLQVWYLEGAAAAGVAAAGTCGVKNKVTLAGTMSGNVTLPYTGDLDGDGHQDLVWRDYTTGDVTLWMLSGEDQVAQETTPAFQEGCPARRRGGADLAGDEVGQGDEPASSDLPGVSGGLEWQVVGLGDLNADGKADLVWQNPETGRVAVWLMDGGQVTAVNEYQAGNATDWLVAALGDLNGDGTADLIWQNGSTGEIKAWLMDPAGGIQEQKPLAAEEMDPSWQVKCAADFCGGASCEVYCKRLDSDQARVITGDGRVIEFQAP